MKRYLGELIGEEVTIMRPTQDRIASTQGRIVDETKMALKIKQQGRVRTILKNNIRVQFKQTGRVISGSALRGRPEERI